MKGTDSVTHQVSFDELVYHSDESKQGRLWLNVKSLETTCHLLLTGGQHANVLWKVLADLLMYRMLLLKFHLPSVDFKQYPYLP
ncbi:hypothetical protein E2542_SST08104 [Spatholobus suberectus]|nr:hypothetical protein E2542_SST08104 [Spatholobus suberectus]